jgi:hypothetical protein
MKSQKLLLTIAMLLLMRSISFAQDLSTPVGYMDAFAKEHDKMNKTYMAYQSAVAHGKRAKKVEKLRQKVIETINDTRNNTRGLGAYKGDNSLRQSSVDYITMVYHVFNDDYAKIVNMEDVIERSYDQMEAYINLQEMTDQKLSEAAQKMNAAEKAFAEKYNIKLIDDKSELSQKMSTAGKLNHYKNKIFLVFFKCNWQDGVITEAMNAKKVNDIEQARNALIKYVEEGLQALDTLKSFNGDASLAMATRQVLNFYKKTAETDLPKLTDFYLKQENFDKIKKAFDAKPESKRTKEDVDGFNKAVNEVNAAINSFNQANNKVNQGRKQVLETTRKQRRNSRIEICLISRDSSSITGNSP